MTVDSLAFGFGLGFAVAAVVGPISLLCMRTVLRGSLAAGIAIGAGAAATASNPSTILSWGAVFAVVSTTGAATAAGETAALLVGVGLGTLTWFTGLSLALAAARRRVGPRLLPAIDAGAGIGLLGFAGVLGWRTLREE